MTEAVSKRLQEFRNKIAHSQRRPDPESLAKQLQDLEISVPPADLQWFTADLLRGFSDVGEHFVPPVLLDVLPLLLEGHSATIACDPCAGFGVLAASVNEAVHAERTIACTRLQQSLALARVLAPHLEWHTGDPLSFLKALSQQPDVVASVLPFGVQAAQAVELRGESGQRVQCAGELGPILLAAASLRLAPGGVGIFVVSSSFFFSQRSILRQLPLLGLGVEAALALPAGSFAPFTRISTYLVVVRKRVLAEMFVAQLSQDIHTNRQIVANLRGRKDDGALELGRFVALGKFSGLEALRLTEHIRQAEHRFQGPALRLGELAQAVQLGRPGDDFEFSTAENALYIPLIGISDVVDSIEAMTLKRQNYAKVVVDPARSDSRFVARFLNSDLGRFIREAHKSGTTIRKLNATVLKELQVFVPNLETQRKILEIETRFGAERNTLLGLQNDLATLRRELWTSPDRLAEVDSRLRVLSSQLTGARPQVATKLEQWFETLPFPLASILRAWQTAPSEDYKTKYEHLLHFFQAVAEFLSIVYLSAYSSRPELFIDQRAKLKRAWEAQHLSLERSTFGTWRVAVEYFAKHTRHLLSSNTEDRTLCAEIFADPTLGLPEMLARVELATVLSAANKLRNDWTGHGGIVSLTEARLRNETLLSEVQRLRDAMEDGWAQVQLIRSLHCKPRRGVFDNEVAVLVGSNSEFLKELRSMSLWLDVERLYLVSRDSERALPLLPLMQVSEKNACYFFNRVDKEGARFISYHFVDQPEFKDKSDATSAAIRSLT